MRAVRIHRPCGPAWLVAEEAPIPYPSTGDVLVRVHAAGITPGELDWESAWFARDGRARSPMVPGREIAGVVAAVGPGVAGLAVGDRVFGLGDPHRDGGLADYAAVEARNLAAVPPGLGFVEAAALVMPGLAAWTALTRHWGPRAGGRVLVHGAGGAVGTMAVRLARAAGASVVGTGRAHDRGRVLAAGADAFVELGGGAGFDGDGAAGAAGIGAWDGLAVGERRGSTTTVRSASQQIPGSVLLAERTRDAERVHAADLVLDLVGDGWAQAGCRGGVLVSVAAPWAPAGCRAVGLVVEPCRRTLEELAGRVLVGRLAVDPPLRYRFDEARQAFVDKEACRPGKAVVEVC